MHTTTHIQNNTISPSVFLEMIRAGAQRIISNESQLNQLNVFPVSDRDTGSNMASLMRFILSQSYSTAELSSLLKQIADASLIGACGNSGMIFSAFFVGLASNKKVSNKDFFTVEEFIDCLHLGVKQAYKAVSNPTKGTILTVMSEWLAEFINACKHTKDFPTIFQKSVSVAEKALNNTEFQLPVLKRNRVVDAGAFGFVKFIQGMCEHLINPHKHKTVDETDLIPAQPDLDIHVHQAEDAPEYRYCMETLLSNTTLDIDAVRKALATQCDSLVINQSPSHVKIHAHTTDVLTITNYLKQFGTIQHQKIDDMQKQWEVTHSRKNRIALVTDSSADFPAAVLLKEQIHVLNTQVKVGEHTFLDRLSIDFDSLEKHVESENVPAKTATPSPELVARYLRYLASHYDSIIVIAVSSKLSGTYQVIANQAANIKTVPISVIDSRQFSAAHGLLVMMAAQWIAKGLAHDEVVKNINDYRRNISSFMAVNNFKTIIKSGRIPRFIQFIGKWNFLKPILSLNKRGKASLSGFAFSQKMSQRNIVKLIQKVIHRSGVRSIALAHTATEAEANEFASFIEKETGVKVDFILKASCSMGLHIGPGCFAIATGKHKLG